MKFPSGVVCGASAELRWHGTREVVFITGVRSFEIFAGRFESCF